MSNRNNNTRTEKWISLISVIFFVLAPFFIIWLLIGEFDLLDVDYVVAHDGVFWKGTVTQANQQWLIDKYKIPIAEYPIGSAVIIKNDVDLIFNPIAILSMFLVLFVSLVYPFVFKILKIGNLDIIPFSFSFSVGFFFIIVCGLIPHWGGTPWRWLLIFIIFMVSLSVTFFVTNKITNRFILKTPFATNVFVDLKTDKKISDKYNESLKDLIAEYKNNDNIEYVETDEEIK